MASLSVIIPVFNEEENLRSIYDRLCATVNGIPATSVEFVFVNDGSSDRSINLITDLSKEDERIRFVDLSRNFGHQVAVMAGLEHCSGDRIVIIDADLQDPPELISDLWAKMNEGYDVVYAKRKARKGEGALKKLTAKLFYRILGKLTNVNIPVDTGDFRMITRRVVEALQNMPEREKYLRGQIAWIGFDQTFVEYDREARAGGDTGYTYSKMTSLALDAITSFSNFPLRFATISGFVVSFISFLLMLYALYSRFVLREYEPGWTSLMLSVLFIGGIQLISVGIIGEYLGRVGANVRQRPLYIVKDTNAKKSGQ